VTERQRYDRRFNGPGLIICPIEYPGRGIRHDEPLATSIEDLAGGLARDLRGWLEAAPYSIIGRTGGLQLGSTSGINQRRGSHQAGALRGKPAQQRKNIAVASSVTIRTQSTG
jgi:hypothetical protein